MEKMIQSKEKLISVIIPIYKPNKDYLLETIKSILQQSYNNYEVLLIVDGDIEDTKEIVDELNDNRFKILINTEGNGLPYSLNRGFRESKGDYIFRMDADDICCPERFAKQVEYLDFHFDIDMIGTFADTFGAVTVLYRSYAASADINAELLFRNPIVHPTVAFRKSSIEKYNLQYCSGECEDYRMWVDMVFGYNCKIEVIPEVLLKYRTHNGQATVAKKTSIDSMDEKISKEILEKLGIELSEESYKAYNKLRNVDRLKLSELDSVLKMKKELRNLLPSSISTATFNKVVDKLILKKLI